MSVSFLDLPPEVRVLIYEYVLVPSKRYLSIAWETEIYRRDTPLFRPFPIAVLQTCKLTYNEASPILYDDTTFDIIPGSFFTGFGTYYIGGVETISSLRNIKKLRLRFPYNGEFGDDSRDGSALTRLLRALDWCSSVKELTILLLDTATTLSRARAIIDTLLEIKCPGEVSLYPAARGSAWTECDGYEALVARCKM